MSAADVLGQQAAPSPGAEALVETFARASGGHEPYPFQLRTAELLLSGRSVLLRAPTGSGKTLAALLPFLHARERGLPFADRLVYALPLRVLAEALYDEAKRAVAAAGLDLGVTVQTGSRPEDPYLEGDIVFATVDQLLSGFLTMPVSLPPGRDNMVAGALVGAYLVVDELHLLEVEGALATTVELARRLRGLSPLLAMSATLSGEALRRLAPLLDAEVVELGEEEVERIPSQRGKERRYRLERRPLDAATIAARHERKTLVVANTVRGAQEVARELRAAAKGGTDIRLLHSRFLPEERLELERWARASFARGAEGSSILVATQVVEAGLDISAERLHTELCPAASLVQRAGRCARFDDERGEVVVWALADPSRPSPYARDEVDATRDALARYEGMSLGFAAEGELLQEVHGERDAARIGGIQWHRLRDQVRRALATGDRALLRELVRDASSTSLLLHDAPQDLDVRRGLAAFSVPDAVWEGFLRRLDLASEPWSVRFLAVSDGEDEGSRYTWPVAAGAAEARNRALVCVHPRHARYDRFLGLVLGEPGEAVERYVERRGTREPFSYHRETFAEHARRARDAIAQTAQPVAAARLEELLGLRPGAVERLAGLVALLHDAGKLTAGWQAAIWAWQLHRQGGGSPDALLAHSDFDGRRDREAEARFPRRPPHAVVGAYLVAGILDAACRREAPAKPAADGCWQATANAIARHHTPRPREFSYLRPHAGAEAALAAVLEPGAALPLLPAPEPVDERAFVPRVLSGVVESDDELTLALHLHLVRRLRLADQRSLEAAP